EKGEVLGLQSVSAWREDIRKPPLVDESANLRLAHDQFRSIFNFIVISLEAKDHGVARVICPFDDVDQFAAKFVENAHKSLRGWPQPRRSTAYQPPRGGQLQSVAMF